MKISAESSREVQVIILKGVKNLKILFPDNNSVLIHCSEMLVRNNSTDGK